MHWEGVVSGEATEFRFGFNVHSVSEEEVCRLEALRVGV